MGRKRQEGPAIVRKYANRRLYDTERSSYITLEDLSEMVREGRDFIVREAQSGRDLTRNVLTQIIAELESSGTNLLPVSVLRQLISFYYGDQSMQSMLPDYLEHAMKGFIENQETFQTHFQDSMERSIEGMMTPVTALEEINRANMELFETALRAWTPFASPMPFGGDKETRLQELRDQVTALEAEIAALEGEG